MADGRLQVRYTDVEVFIPKKIPIGLPCEDEAEYGEPRSRGRGTGPVFGLLRALGVLRG